MDLDTIRLTTTPQSHHDAHHDAPTNATSLLTTTTPAPHAPRSPTYSNASATQKHYQSSPTPARP
eukprot:6063459-Pyramimonas_sp.AAC.1